MLLSQKELGQAAPLFAGWEETMIWSCLEGAMGRVFAAGRPVCSAAARIADFCFLAGRPDAALLWWEDRWWLSLGAGEEQAIARLSEFGRCETARPHLEARLAEHGRPVWDQDALTALLSYFPV